VTSLEVVVLGQAPPWLAFTIWLVIGALVALLWRAVREQADREHAQLCADRDRLDEFAARLDDIERSMFLNDPPRMTNGGRNQY
jgi:membrane protein implicated in regulation of membrane protease activity